MTAEGPFGISEFRFQNSDFQTVNMREIATLQSEIASCNLKSAI
jgi:hypothetical protein